MDSLKLQKLIDSNESKIHARLTNGLFRDGMSHFFEEHVATTREELLARIAQQGRGRFTCFRSEKEALSFLCETLYCKADSISKRLSGNTREEQGPNVDENGDWSTSAHFGNGEVVGFGFNSSFHEVETSDICVVLQKDASSVLGFFVRTAYPDLRNREHVRPTGFRAYSILLQPAETQTPQDIAIASHADSATS